jgi:hypothetical protein
MAADPKADDNGPAKVADKDRRREVSIRASAVRETLGGLSVVVV